MKRTLVTVFCVLVLVSMAGCKQNIAALIESEEVLLIEVFEQGRPVQWQSLERSSSKYQELLAWAKANTSGWSLSSVTYTPAMVIRGKAFSMNVRRETVIFASNDGQYSKSISTEEHAWFEKILRNKFDSTS